MSKETIDTRTDVPESSYGSGQYKQLDIKSARVAVISTADDSVNVTEPSTPTHPQYPYNNVSQSLSGHIREVDDTPGAERIFEMHKSGTFYEVHPDGSKVTKIFGDDFYIILKDHNLVVGGNLNITVQGNANFLVKGDMKTKVDGDYNLTVNGNMTTRVEGSTLLYSKGDLDVQTASKFNLRVSAKTDFKLVSGFSIETTSYAVKTNTTKMSSSGRTDIIAAPLHFNPTGVSGASKVPLKDKDPTAGLSVSQSVIEPSADTLLKIRTNNVDIIQLDDDFTQFPKHRTKP